MAKKHLIYSVFSTGDFAEIDFQTKKKSEVNRIVKHLAKYGKKQVTMIHSYNVKSK